MNPIKKVGIAGAGTMGFSLAQIIAKHGYEVYLYDIFEQAIEKAKKIMRLNQETEVKENILTQEESDALMARIQFGTTTEGFKDVDFLVEAILEKIDIKHKFWGEISKFVKPEAILVSNTSGLSITKIAEVIDRPERFAGMHWINPPHIIPLVEVISGEKTSEETAGSVYTFCEILGKKPVQIKDAPGFALNRIQFAILRECLHIYEQGIASIEDIDKVMKFGLGPRYAVFGPFEVADLGGLDIFHNISSYLFADLGTETDSFSKLKENFESNHLGVKNGAGFYDYSDGKDMEVIRYRDEMYTKVAKVLFG